MLAATLSLCALLVLGVSPAAGGETQPSADSTPVAAGSTEPAAAEESNRPELPAESEPATAESTDVAPVDSPANKPARKPTDEPGSDEPAADDAPTPRAASEDPAEQDEPGKLEIEFSDPSDNEAGDPAADSSNPPAVENTDPPPDDPYAPSSVQPLSPDLVRLRDLVRKTLAFYFRRPVNARENTPWEVFHWIIGYNVAAEIRADGPTGPAHNAVGWMCFNRTCAGQRLLTVEQGRVRALYGVGLQGHEGQFLAILAQSMVSPDYPMQVGRQKFTIRDLIRSEQLGCTSGHDVELMFKLIGLSHYLDLDEVWQNRAGETWGIPRLIREEIVKPIQGSACGGTHRLMGLSYASQMRVRRGQPLDGEYLRAAHYIRDYQIYTLGMQNPDGSFSTAWFARRESRNDMDRKIQTTGHILEWLVFSLPHADLRHPQVVKAVNFVSSTLMADRKHAWEIGPLGHALRALSLYDRRVFQPAEATVPPQIVRQPAPERDAPPRPRTSSRPTRDTAAQATPPKPAVPQTGVPKSASPQATNSAAPAEVAPAIEPNRLARPSQAVKVPIEVEEPTAEESPVPAPAADAPNQSVPEQPVTEQDAHDETTEKADPDQGQHTTDGGEQTQPVGPPPASESPAESESAAGKPTKSPAEAQAPSGDKPSLGPSIRGPADKSRTQRKKATVPMSGESDAEQSAAGPPLEPTTPVGERPTTTPERDSDLMLKSLHPSTPEQDAGTDGAESPAAKPTPGKAPAVLNPALLHKARELGEREARRRSNSPSSSTRPMSSTGNLRQPPLAAEPRLIPPRPDENQSAQPTDSVSPASAEAPITGPSRPARGGVVRSAGTRFRPRQ
jgi:hypothetical protein